nr:hypothetical protein [Pandoravirus aubagnensis]
MPFSCGGVLLGLSCRSAGPFGCLSFPFFSLYGQSGAKLDQVQVWTLVRHAVCDFCPCFIAVANGFYYVPADARAVLQTTHSFFYIFSTEKRALSLWPRPSTMPRRHTRGSKEGACAWQHQIPCLFFLPFSL